MESIIQITSYIALVSGSILALLMLLSILGGLDLDVDIDGGDTDVDAGGLGLIKSGLTFITFASWVAYIMLSASINPILTLFASLAVGALTVFILAWFLKFLLGLQSDVNWDFHQAQGKSAKVYLKIPKDGKGIIQVDINGVTREINALSSENKEISTGSEVLVLEVEDEIAKVVLYEKK